MTESYMVIYNFARLVAFIPELIGSTPVAGKQAQAS